MYQSRRVSRNCRGLTHSALSKLNLDDSLENVKALHKC